MPLRVVRSLGLEFGYERSLKMRAGVVLWQRYLLGIDTATLSPEVLGQLLRMVGFPLRHRQEFDAALADANLLLLGFERDGPRVVLKVYLEFWERIIAAVRADPQDLRPRLMFLGFKWDAADPSVSRVARYQCHPRLSKDVILDRVGALLGAGTAFRATREVVELAARHGDSGAFKYLDVGEDGSTRNSFDLNLYSGGLRVRDIRAQLLDLGRHFGLDIAALERELDPIDAGMLGHVSAGFSGTGADFFSVYYEPASLA